MVANNIAELERMLMSRMKAAMNVAAAKMEADVYEQTYSFYAQGNPKVYVRTGALGNTPKVTAAKASDKTVSFDVYLDTNYQYSTGDNPSMQQVLELAENGTAWTTKSGAPARSTVGNGGFWKRSENTFQKTLDNVMSSFFE